MGLESANIIFDNQTATYYAGDTVSGRFVMNLTSPKKVRALKIKFVGKCTIEWTEHESRTNNEGKSENEIVYYTGEEVYFQTEYNLVGGQGTELELPVGQHVHPFTCVLPPTLPSSFEGDYGHIRYTVKVTLDRPWKFDQDVKSAFTVLSNVDVNANPQLKQPVTVNFEKYFCCCWCKSGPLTCVVTLPYTGFVPGQMIPVVAEIDNISNVDITDVEFAFRKREAYHSRIPRWNTRENVVLLEKIVVGPVAANGSKTYNQPVMVPSLPPSNLTNCSLIDLDYELYIEVHVSGLHANLTGKIPLVIGTIPLNANSMNYNSESVAVNMTDNAPPVIGWTANLNPISPPTFTESKFGTKSIQDANDNQHTVFPGKEFAPRYPFYSFAPSAPAME